MKVASWNVNSVRARCDRLLAWLEAQKPDVVCLQELKVQDDKFPLEAVRALGYDAVTHGQRTYNGVAILSRIPLEDVRRGLDDGVADDEARLISARVAGARVISVYVPNGQRPDSPKFPYKLHWLERLRSYLERNHSAQEPLLLCGDFNVAPDDRDCYDPPGWAETVLCHPEVRTRLEHLVSWGLSDTFRLHVAEGGHYSWWDYRQLAFPKRRGLRIDLILATEPLAARCSAASIDREQRKGKLPSDHAPVLAEFDLPRSETEP